MGEIIKLVIGVVVVGWVVVAPVVLVLLMVWPERGISLQGLRRGRGCREGLRG